MKKHMLKYISLIALVLPFMVLTACSGGNGGSAGGTSSIPLTAPQTLVITALDGGLAVNFTHLAAIQDTRPTDYDLEISSDGINYTISDVEPTIAGNFVTANITGLTNKTKYYIKARATYGSYGTSDWGSATSGTPIPPPNMPVITTGNYGSSAIDTIINAKWSEQSGLAASYTIAYTTGNSTATTPPDGASTIISTKLGAIISGLTTGETYTFWVKATNSAGSSDYSTPYALTVSAATANPSAPSAGAIVASSGQLTVTFNEASKASSYKVRYSTSNDSTTGTEISVNAESLSISKTITGLTNGTLYYIWAKSVNSHGESAYTPMGSGTPEAKTSSIDWSDASFVLGTVTAEYSFVDDSPHSVFLPAQFFKRTPYIDRAISSKETALGNLLADSVKWYAKNTLGINVDFAFVNGGQMEGSIAPGDFTVGNLLSLVTSTYTSDYLVIVSMSGEDVIKLFKQAAKYARIGHGGKLYNYQGTTYNYGYWAIPSSEIKYSIKYLNIDESQFDYTGSTSTYKDGTSIASGALNQYYLGWLLTDTLKLNGVPIDLSKTYEVVTTNTIASNIHYSAFTHGISDVYSSHYYWQAVGSYIYEMKSVTPTTDGRISLIGGVPMSSGWTAGSTNDAIGCLDTSDMVHTSTCSFAIPYDYYTIY